MLNFNKKLIISQHVAERVIERRFMFQHIDQKRLKANPKAFIASQLKPMMIKKTVKINGDLHVITKGNQTFVLREVKDGYIVKTVAERKMTMRKVGA